jgi:hypothetical protein
MAVFKIREQQGKTGLVWVYVFLYDNGKMRPVEMLFQEWQEG